MNNSPRRNRHHGLRALLVAAAILLGAQPASANAPEAALSADELRMVGEARLRVLFWSVYDSRLYTVDGEYEEGQLPLRLEIEYLIDIASAALVERTLEEWEAMDRSHPRQSEWLRELQQLWPDIEAGDVLTLDLAADGTAVFYRNGAPLGVVDDPEFGPHFAAIWLSEECTRPELRLALIGREND